MRRGYYRLGMDTEIQELHFLSRTRYRNLAVMKSSATTPKMYLAELPLERKKAIATVRDEILHQKSRAV